MILHHETYLKYHILDHKDTLLWIFTTGELSNFEMLLRIN